MGQQLFGWKDGKMTHERTEKICLVSPTRGYSAVNKAVGWLNSEHARERSWGIAILYSKYL